MLETSPTIVSRIQPTISHEARAAGCNGGIAHHLPWRTADLTTFCRVRSSRVFFFFFTFFCFQSANRASMHFSFCSLPICPVLFSFCLDFSSCICERDGGFERRESLGFFLLFVLVCVEAVERERNGMAWGIFIPSRVFWGKGDGGREVRSVEGKEVENGWGGKTLEGVEGFDG